MKKNEYNAVLLTAQNASQKEFGIYMELFDEYDLFYKINKSSMVYKDCALQYLYILSDEEITGNGVIYRTDTKTVHEYISATKHTVGVPNIGGVNMDLCRKVIATNDPQFLSPTTKESILIDNTFVPGLLQPIDDEFINSYIQNHNAGKPVSKVDVDFIDEPVFKPILVDDIGLAYDATQRYTKMIISIAGEKIFSRSEAKKIAHLAAKIGYDNYNANVKHEEKLIEDWFNKNYPQ